MDLFYDEAKKLYSDYTENDKVSQEILNECFLLNRKLMRIHGEYEDVKLGLNYNLVDFYNSVLELEKIEIKNNHKIYKSLNQIWFLNLTLTDERGNLVWSQKWQIFM